MSLLVPLSLAALLLLPGLLVVRAPWTAVPALSLAFWALTAWWPPLAGLGRGRFLSAALLASGLLALLRLLPRHEVPPPPGWTPPPAAPPPARPGLPPPRLASVASLLVLAASLALLAPVPLWHHAPGPRLAFQTTTARLLVWRDAVPATAEPLVPLAPVGAHAPALATLAADASHLSGLDPAVSVLLVAVAAAGLLLVGLFALHATWAPPRAAALGALVGLAAAPWPGTLVPWGEGEALLALGLALPAAALLLGHASRSSAVAAGNAARRLRARAACPRRDRAVRVHDRSEPEPPGRPVPPGPLRHCRPPPRGPRALAPRPVPLATRGGGRPALRSSPRAASPSRSASCSRPSPHSSSSASRNLARARDRLVTAALALVATALLVARVHGWIASGQLPPPVRVALLRVAAETDPLQVVCAPEGPRDWVPALAGRAAGEPGPWVPPVYGEEWALRPAGGAALAWTASFPGRDNV